MIRIPIRKWEKVTERFVSYRSEDHYRLEVVLNGEVLECAVTVPTYLAAKDPEVLRQHIIGSVSQQIGAVVADEIRRTIV